MAKKVKKKKVNNLVQKHLFTFNKPKVEDDKSKYNRKREKSVDIDKELD